MLYVLVQPSLRDVIVWCEEAADCYGVAARTVNDRDLATLFDRLAHSRRAMATVLGGFLEPTASPGAPPNRDPDMGQRLFGRLKAVLIGDPRRILIDRCERTDRAFARSLAEVRDSGWPDRLNCQLALFLGEVTAALGLLAVARVRVP